MMRKCLTVVPRGHGPPVVTDLSPETNYLWDGFRNVFEMVLWTCLELGAEGSFMLLYIEVETGLPIERVRYHVDRLVRRGYVQRINGTHYVWSGPSAEAIGKLFPRVDYDDAPSPGQPSPAPSAPGTGKPIIPRGSDAERVLWAAHATEDAGFRAEDLAARLGLAVDAVYFHLESLIRLGYVTWRSSTAQFLWVGVVDEEFVRRHGRPPRVRSAA